MDLPRTHKPNSAAETEKGMPIWATSRTYPGQGEGKARVYLWRSLIFQQIRDYLRTILGVETPFHL